MEDKKSPLTIHHDDGPPTADHNGYVTENSEYIIVQGDPSENKQEINLDGLQMRESKTSTTPIPIPAPPPSPVDEKKNNLNGVDPQLMLEIKNMLADIKSDIKDLRESKKREYTKIDRCQCTTKSAITCLIFLTLGGLCIYTLFMPYTGKQSSVFPKSLNDVLYILYVSTLLYIIAYFVVNVILCVFIYPLRKACKNIMRDKNYQPGVSVLIPAYNEEIGILPTLYSVMASDYKNLLEIIIINDGSKDRTHDIITNFLKTHDQKKVPIQYLNIENGGKANALNKGLAIVSNKCEIVYTIDSDSIIHKSCLRNIVRSFYDEKVGTCAGVTVIGNDGINSRLISIAQQFEYMYGFFIKRGQSIFNLVWVVGGANAAYRKSVLDKVGGIPTGLMTEDIALTFSIICEGYKVAYDDESVVFTEGPPSVKGLCKQRFRWTYGKYQTWMKYRKIFFNTEHCHSMLLSWVYLPVLVINELMSALLFPWVFPLGVIQIISIHSATYLAYLNMAFCLMTVLAIMTDPILRKYHYNILIIAPCSLLVVYVMSFVDMQSSLRTYWAFFKNKTPSWGNWNRKGINT